MYLRDGLQSKRSSGASGLARNTIKAWLRKGEMVEPGTPAGESRPSRRLYRKRWRPGSRPTQYRGKRDRRTIKALYEGLLEQGLHRWLRPVWRPLPGAGEPSSRARSARVLFVPLKFALATRSSSTGAPNAWWAGACLRWPTQAIAAAVPSGSAHPSQSHEMLFDAHAFAASAACPSGHLRQHEDGRGQGVALGKKPHDQQRALAMTGHYLSRARVLQRRPAGEGHRREERARPAHRITRRQATLGPTCAALNTWLRASVALPGPNSTTRMADAEGGRRLQDEQQRLMPNPGRSDGYIEVLARVPARALVHQRNRYSVPPHANPRGGQPAPVSRTH